MVPPDRRFVSTTLPEHRGAVLSWRGSGRLGAVRAPSRAVVACCRRGFRPAARRDLCGDAITKSLLIAARALADPAVLSSTNADRGGLSTPWPRHRRHFGADAPEFQTGFRPLLRAVPMCLFGVGCRRRLLLATSTETTGF